jgi:hypothetical protein
MKKISLKAISGFAMPIILLLAAVQIPASAQEARDTQARERSGDTLDISPSANKEERIEGVWDSRVTIINCQTGASITSFRAMETFLRGGGLVDTNAAPPSTRGPGLGRWQYVGGGQYTASFRFFLYNPDGTFAGVRRVSRTIDLGFGGDTLTSTVAIQVFDPNDILISTACATETARRVE